MNASPGAAVGRVVFDSHVAVEWAERGYDEQCRVAGPAGVPMTPAGGAGSPSAPTTPAAQGTS